MEADDRWKVEGWQTQKKRGWVAGQAQMEEILGKAVIIDGQEEWYCRYYSEWSKSTEYSVSGAKTCPGVKRVWTAFKDGRQRL